MKKTLSQKVKTVSHNFGTFFKKSVCLLLSVTTFLGATAFTSLAGELKGDDSTSSTLEEMQSLVAASSYADYIATFAGSQPEGLTTYPIDLIGGMVESTDVVITANSQACLDSREKNPGAWTKFGTESWNNSVYLPTVSSDGKQAGSASWVFNISKEQEGLYYLRIEYFNCQIDYTDTDLSDGDSSESSSVSAIQRKLMIDGKIPFKEVSSITFDKHWIYDYDDPESVTTEITTGEIGTTVEYKTDDKGYHKIVTEIWQDGAKLKKTDGVTHTALRHSAQQHSRLAVKRDALLCRNIAKSVSKHGRGNSAEIIALATGNDSRGQLLQLGGRQNKYNVCRRLLESL
mgnify:CR=1 FL=1